MKVSKKKKSYRERQNQEIFSERQRKYIGVGRLGYHIWPIPRKKYFYRIYLFRTFSEIRVEIDGTRVFVISRFLAKTWRMMLVTRFIK